MIVIVSDTPGVIASLIFREESAVLLDKDAKWDKTADVVVIGYGMAGAVGAITAHDAGAKVIILEKQPAESHCTFSSMSGGIFLAPSTVEGGITYMEALCRVNDDMWWTPQDIIEVWARKTVENKDYVEKLSGTTLRYLHKGGEHPELPGCDAIDVWGYRGMGYRMMMMFYDQVSSRKIEVMYSTPAQELMTNVGGEVVGVVAHDEGGKPQNIKARRAVLLVCGGFEFNEQMKLQYLKVYPSWFDGFTSNTGDGVKMAIKVGADLWHMNCVSARLAAKFPGFPIPFKFDYGGKGWTRRQIHGSEAPEAAGFIIVNRYGRRFMTENLKLHCAYYETTGFDTHRLEHPRVPSYFIFDRIRMEEGPLPGRTSGPAGPHKLYKWSPDNRAELEKGWITEGKTLGELGRKLGMPTGVLEGTVRSWNRYCAKGKDPDFGRRANELLPLSNPPFYAIQLLPGGANTQGGPRRNKHAQIVNPDGDPIPGLYGAGELGSVYGMLYPVGGGNLAECIAFGRIAGENAAKEKPRA
ncbi:MAG: FAD-binding protein [Chloroflexi bacterium]|nr:FAD-binding protein [Chloroflexota bacterium]